jgi:hypothetical protein
MCRTCITITTISIFDLLLCHTWRERVGCPGSGAGHAVGVAALIVVLHVVVVSAGQVVLPARGCCHGGCHALRGGHGALVVTLGGDRACIRKVYIRGDA